jgi:hypothetical protein
MKEQLNYKSIRYNWHDADVTILEGLLARGDRRLSKSIYDAYKKGCVYDAWSEYFKNDIWLQVLNENSVDIAFYTSRERNEEEIFPWDFIDIGVSKKFLLKEYQRAKEEVVTPNCKVSCSGCGAASFEAGICLR